MPHFIEFKAYSRLHKLKGPESGLYMVVVFFNPENKLFMSLESVLVFVLIVCIVILFYTEWVPFDVTALIMAGVLMATGILSPSEGLSGFSNPATITIASMFVLSEGIRRTGALQWVDSFFTSLGKKDFNIAMLSMMGVIGGISAFINNTAAVALFIPVALGVAANLGVSPSKLLMPVSFASMFGGVCTLIGTSTNILVSPIMQQHGLPPFSMFEFAPPGPHPCRRRPGISFCRRDQVNPQQACERRPYISLRDESLSYRRNCGAGV